MPAMIMPALMAFLGSIIFTIISAFDRDLGVVLAIPVCALVVVLIVIQYFKLKKARCICNDR